MNQQWLTSGTGFSSDCSEFSQYLIARAHKEELEHEAASELESYKVSEDQLKVLRDVGEVVVKCARAFGDKESSQGRDASFPSNARVQIGAASVPQAPPLEQALELADAYARKAFGEDLDSLIERAGKQFGADTRTSEGWTEADIRDLVSDDE